MPTWWKGIISPVDKYLGHYLYNNFIRGLPPSPTVPGLHVIQHISDWFAQCASQGLRNYFPNLILPDIFHVIIASDKETHLSWKTTLAAPAMLQPIVIRSATVCCGWRPYLKQVVGYFRRLTNYHFDTTSVLCKR